MEPLTLYHAPPSFYSQIARLALTEAGLTYEDKIIIPGPPHFSTYAPAYMKLNPGGWVPTLVVGNHVIDDSRKIVEWAAGLDLTPPLVPVTAQERAVMDEWIGRAYGLSERELAYGSGLIKTIGRVVNHKRLKTLKKFRTQNPGMSAIYDTKIADIEDFITKAGDKRHVASLAARFDDEFAALDQLLANQAFIAGGAYSLADTCWTVAIARHKMLKTDPVLGRPNLARWFNEVKQRPSYDAAGIMDHFSFRPLLKMLRNQITLKDLPSALPQASLAVDEAAKV